MLRGLDIRDILIIDRLELRFQPGLNVLTGETGAGKSILLDALGFVLGWRGRADLVRQGAAQGEVTAWFDIDPDHPARAVLQEAGLPEADELVLRRTNSPEGRKTAWVNDRRASGEMLRQLADCLVELHGQHDERGLLDPKSHLALLDAYAAHEDLRAALRAAWADLTEARHAQTRARAALAAAQAEEDFLRHAVPELEAMAARVGEDAELDSRRRQMRAAERLGGDVVRAAQALGADGAEQQIASAVRWLEDAADSLGDHLTAPLAALERVLVELSEAQAGVDACLEALQFDPHELEAAEERLFALRALARKHGVGPDELPALAETLATRLGALDKGATHLAALDAAEAAARAAYDRAAADLSQSRVAAGLRLDAAMRAELTPLKMERAVFTTTRAPGKDGPDGRDAVSFQVAPNPGAPAGPLEKIASGGELSRFLLALKVCLTTGNTGQTLIFDEIDRGVGGATADAVGRRLAALANETGGQVLVVTHSPQVAALGNHHWRVEKRILGNVTLSTVTALAPDDRIDEIARMLSGDQITPEARSAARSLLAP